MSRVIVNEWRGYGKDLLYVRDAATGDKVAVFDRNTGKLNLVDENREAETVRALRPFLAGALPPPMAERLLEGTPASGKDLTGQQSQKWMQRRVMLQAAAIVVIILILLVAGQSSQ